MKLRIMAGTIAVLTMCGASGAFAQSAASNKSFLTHSNGLTFAPVSGAGYSEPMKLFSVMQAVKTSSGGALTATVSMETLLSTYNLTQAIVNGGKSSSSSRAAIKAWVEV